jgi:ferredoxin
LLRATVKAGLRIGQSCRGIGICAACKVRVLEGEVDSPHEIERELMQRVPIAPDERYSCRARVVGPCSITTTYW